MTPLTLICLTLYTWIVSPGSRLSLALSQHEHETEMWHALSNSLYNKVTIEGTKKLAFTFQSKENVQVDSAFLSCVTLRCFTLLENPSPEAWIGPEHQQHHLSAIICPSNRSRKTTPKGPSAITVVLFAMESSAVNRHPNGIIYRLGKVLISSFLLLLAIIVIRLILIVSDFRYSNNSFVVGLLTLTLHCLPPPALRPPGWSFVLRHTAFGITFVLYITCGLGKPIHVLIAFRATWTVFQWLCHSHQQQACILPLSAAQLMVCVVWFFVTQMSPNRNGRQLCCENIIRERDVQFAHVIYWATSYFLCFSFTLLLRSIQAKLNVFSAPMHMRLLACLQYARVITKYIIVIKLNMPL
ncbi:unnamed protein product [Gadus morhua 'NCC']